MNNPLQSTQTCRFAVYVDPSKTTSGQRFWCNLAMELKRVSVPLNDNPDIVLFNISAPLKELIKARLRHQKIVLRLDGIYHDCLSPASISSFKFAPLRWLLRLGLQFPTLRSPLSDLANLIDRNYGGVIRVLLAHRVIYQSQFCRTSWARYFPNKPSVIIVNGAPWEGSICNIAKDETDQDVQLITTYNDWKPAKRIDELIHFIHWANELKGIPIRLTILGFSGTWPETYGDDRKELLSQRRYIRTTPRFEMLEGTVADNFIDSHAYVTLTFRDPCPNVVIEAMSYGLPVIATASGGLPDIVGNAGELVSIEDDTNRHFCASRYENAFPPVDYEVLLSAILDVVRNNELYRERVEKRFEQELDIRVVARKYADYIETKG